MNSILPSVPLYMRKCTEMCPLKWGKKQILCSNWAHAQSEQRTTQLGMAASVASGNTTPSVAFPRHLQSRPAADPGQHLCGPERTLTAPSDFNSAYVLCGKSRKLINNGSLLHRFFPSSFCKSSERGKPFENSSGVLWKTQTRVWAQWHLCPLKNNRPNTEIPFISLMTQQRQMNQQNWKSKKGWFIIGLEYVLTISSRMRMGPWWRTHWEENGIRFYDTKRIL